MQRQKRKEERWKKKTGEYCPYAEKVVFSFHALSKFVYLTHLNRKVVKIDKKYLPEFAEEIAREILHKSRREKLNGFHVLRTMKHGFVLADYFVSLCGWRFVVINNDGILTVRTIDRSNSAENLPRRRPL